VDALLVREICRTHDQIDAGPVSVGVVMPLTADALLVREICRTHDQIDAGPVSVGVVLRLAKGT